MNISHKVLPMPSIEAQEEVARQVVDGYVPGTLCSQFRYNETGENRQRSSESLN